ncbi:hypothetical protein ACP4OV_018489 [Aristida adscensionis]
MDEMAVSVSKGVMDSVLAKLNNLIGDSFTGLIGVSSDVRFLRDELPAISALLQRLEDADKLDEQTKVWRDEVREMSFEIEDCIDEYRNNVGSAEARDGFMNRVSHFLKTLRARVQTSLQIKELKVRLQELGERRKRYKLDDDIPSTTSVDIDPRLPAFYNEAADLVGIEGPKKEVANWVMDGVEQLKVISIVGFPGLGKTTLANEVYREAGGQINCKALVSVSRKPDIASLLYKMSSHLRVDRPSSSHTCEAKDLIDDIRDHLQDKRYIIVVDDLWHVQAWNIIRYAFPENDKQSRVIVTTRHMNVAEACSTHRCIYTMKPLSVQDSKKLFFKRIFGSEEDWPPRFMEISCEILKKCGGLPLAIITVASILACCQPTMLQHQWEHIKNSLGTQYLTNPTLEDMRRILDFSYMSLPSHLKTCFLYLGTYPEDHKIRKDELVQKLVAEGFVNHHVGTSAWDVAERCLNELVNRSMIQPVYNGACENKVSHYRVHDMMLDLIVSKCIENNFLSLVDNPKEKVRRLSIHLSGVEHDTTDVVIGKQLAKVRSLSIFGATHMLPFSELKFLRVLSLVEFPSEVRRIDLTCINQLSQLRYLKVAGANWRIEQEYSLVLPSSIQSMQHLETLEIDGISVSSIPQDIVDLPCLSHLIMPKDTMLPTGICKVNSLRTLKWFRLPTGSSEIIKGFGELTNLVELRLDCRTMVGANRGCIPMPTAWVAAWSSSLQKLGNLRVLHIFASRHFSCCADALSSLSRPFPKLEYLNVLGWTFSRVPRWIGDLHNLRTLYFRMKEVSSFSRDDDVTNLGKLPCLTHLYLRIEGNVPAEGIVVGGNTGFTVLKIFALEIKRTSYLKFETGAMPNLQWMSLVVHRDECENAATSIGLEHLLSLKYIGISGQSLEGDDRYEEPGESTEFGKFTAMFREAVNSLPGRPKFEAFCGGRPWRPWNAEAGASSADAPTS